MLVSGEVAELGEVSSGLGDPVLRLRAPLGSTLSGVMWAESVLLLSSLKAGLMVISGLLLTPPALVWRASLAGDLGPVFTVIVRPES